MASTTSPFTIAASSQSKMCDELSRLRLRHFKHILYFSRPHQGWNTKQASVMATSLVSAKRSTTLHLSDLGSNISIVLQASQSEVRKIERKVHSVSGVCAIGVDTNARGVAGGEVRQGRKRDCYNTRRGGSDRTGDNTAEKKK